MAIDDFKGEYEETTFEHTDEVNSPQHYTSGDGIECIDYIRQVLGIEGFKYWCWGNIIKYQHRHEQKGDSMKDMQKCNFYMKKMIATMEEMQDRVEDLSSVLTGGKDGQ